MSNRYGQIYAVTALCPIIDDPTADVPHHLQLRRYLASLEGDQRSPLSRCPGTHMARLVVLDDVVFVGAPASEDHLRSRYLVFTSNFDGDRDAYLTAMARDAREFVDEVWRHCVGYLQRGAAAFASYIESCQLETTFFFADVGDRTVQQTLRALQVQAELAVFIERFQGKKGDDLKGEFMRFQRHVDKLLPPVPGSPEIIVSGGAAPDRPAARLARAPRGFPRSSARRRSRTDRG